MDGAVTHGFGEGGAATFTAPGGETISAFTLWRYEAVGPSVPYATPEDTIAYYPGNVSIEETRSIACPPRTRLASAG
jgi:hypothetical protein